MVFFSLAGFSGSLGGVFTGRFGSGSIRGSRMRFLRGCEFVLGGLIRTRRFRLFRSESVLTFAVGRVGFGAFGIGGGFSLVTCVLSLGVLLVFRSLLGIVFRRVLVACGVGLAGGRCLRFVGSGRLFLFV